MTLSDYIHDDLLARIARGEIGEGGLTLKSLAHDYEVSLSPVRRAVEALVEAGALVKQSNGRLILGAKPPKGSRVAETPVARAPDATLRMSKAEGELREDCLRRSLDGDLRYLREEATAKRYGISRMQLRQVFARLQGEGILEHVPRRGWRVHAFDLADMDAFLEVREVLEIKALDLARDHLDRRVIERMLRGNRPRASDPQRSFDNDLHGYFVACSGNRSLQEFFALPSSRFYMAVFEHAAPGADIVAEMADQHGEILQAILDGDWSTARRVLRTHIRIQHEIVEALLGQEEALVGD